MAGIEGWVRICAIDDIPLLGARVLERDGGEDIALFRPAAERARQARPSFSPGRSPVTTISISPSG